MNLSERLRHHLGKEPSIGPSVYLHPTAVIVGDVDLEADVSVWPHSVLRADINQIRVGRGTNLQDGVIVHLADDFGVQIGAFCTVGHGAIIHAATIEDECLIGMRATVLDGAVIGHQSIVGAGALVPKGMTVPPRSLVLGLPARVVRPLTPEEASGCRKMAEKYIEVARAHRDRSSGRRDCRRTQD